MISCVVIDDEPAALSILKEYVDKTSFLTLAASFRDPVEALSFCQTEDVGLIFLDINMPNLNGMQFYRALSKKPQVVFTTAYSEFAVESYELKATDYLLKPINYDRFIGAASKVLENTENKRSKEAKQINLDKDQEVIYVKSGHQLHRLNLADILFLEKDGHYLTFHTKEKKVLCRMNMKQAFDIVPEGDFVQIHKSFIVAWKHLDVVEMNQVYISGQKIPVGVSYREGFNKRLRSK